MNDNSRLVISSLILMAEKLLEERLGPLEALGQKNKMSLRKAKEELIACQTKLFQPSKGRIPSIQESSKYFKTLNSRNIQSEGKLNTEQDYQIVNQEKEKICRGALTNKSRRSSISSLGSKQQPKPKVPVKNSDRCLVNKVFVPKIPLAPPPKQKITEQSLADMNQNVNQGKISEYMIEGMPPNPLADMASSRDHTDINVSENQRSDDLFWMKPYNLVDGNKENVPCYKAKVNNMQEGLTLEKDAITSGKEILSQIDEGFKAKVNNQMIVQKDQSLKAISSSRSSSDYFDLFSKRQTMMRARLKQIEADDYQNLMDRFKAFNNIDWMIDKESSRCLDMNQIKNAGIDPQETVRHTEGEVSHHEQVDINRCDQDQHLSQLMNASNMRLEDDHPLIQIQRPKSPLKHQVMSKVDNQNKPKNTGILKKSREIIKAKEPKSRSNSQSKERYNKREKVKSKELKLHNTTKRITDLKTENFKHQKANTQPIKNITEVSSSGNKDWLQCLDNIEKINQKVLENGALLTEIRNTTELEDEMSGKKSVGKGRYSKEFLEEKSNILSAHEFESFSKLDSTNRHHKLNTLQKRELSPFQQRQSKKSVSIREDGSESEMIESANAILSRFSNSPLVLK